MGMFLDYFFPNARKNIREVVKQTFNLPDKDPNDYTLTKSSTSWLTEKYCPKCKATIGHDEWMSEICNNCGTIYSGLFSEIRSSKRVYRQIIQDGKWVYQYKYPGKYDELDNFEIRPTPHIGIGKR